MSGITGGMLLGLGIHLYSNALRKVRYFQKPWEHALAMGIGGFMGKKYVEFEEQQKKELIREMELVGKSSEAFK